MSEPVQNPDDKAARKPSWLSIRVPEWARCSACGSRELSPLPTFCVGQGIAFKPICEDVYCRGCSRIGVPDLVFDADKR